MHIKRCATVGVKYNFCSATSQTYSMIAGGEAEGEWVDAMSTFVTSGQQYETGHLYTPYLPEPPVRGNGGYALAIIHGRRLSPPTGK